MSKYLDKVEEKIKNFEMAFVPDKGSFVLPKLNSILLALDAHEWAIDSSRFSIQTAAELSQYHGAFIQIICMAVNEYEYVESEVLVSEAVEYFQSRKIDCSGLCIIGSPSTNILKLVEDESHDLVIMPSPYAERIDKENLDSLGTTVELVINRSKVPVLLMTKSISKLGRVNEKILLPIISKDDFTLIEWGLLLSDENTRINVLNIIRKNILEDIREVSKDLYTQEVKLNLVEASLRRNTASILSALRQISTEMGLTINISKRVGDPVECIEDEVSKNDLTLILSNYSIALEEGARLVKFSKKQKIPLLIIN